MELPGLHEHRGVDPVLEVIEPHHPPLHGLDHDGAGVPFIRRLGARIDHGSRETPQPERTSLDHRLIEQGRRAHIDPGQGGGGRPGS